MTGVRGRLLNDQPCYKEYSWMWEVLDWVVGFWFEGV